MIVSRSDRSIFALWLWTIDRWLLFSFLLLACFGIIISLTSSSNIALNLGYDSYYFSIRHILFTILSLFIVLLFSNLSVKKIKTISIISLSILLLLLFYSSQYGLTVKGAKRWVEIFGQSFQPSELLKPFYIVTNAWLLSMWKRNRAIKPFIISIGLVSVINSILLSQPDLGMTLLITMIWTFQVIIVGIPAVFFVLLIFITPTVIFFSYHFYSHVYIRINDFFAGNSFQLNQATKSFYDGGFFGKGIGEGSLKNNLPDAHTDFIFSVVAEEFGLIFCLIIFILNSIIIFRPIIFTFKLNDLFNILSISGLSILFGVQALIHISSNLAIIPTKGMTLPFLSYGGSSTLSAAILIGLLIGLTKKSFDFSEINQNFVNYK